MGEPVDRDSILAGCVDALESGDRASIDNACAEHPSLAEDIRSAAAALVGLGADRPPARLPRSIGRFEILGELGRGGSGIVYLARDPKLDRQLALKILAPGFTAIPEALERFQREAIALARVQHPNIVAIHDRGETAEGLPYFTMPLVEGSSLDEILRRVAGRDPRSLRPEDLLPEKQHTGAHGRRAASYVEAIVRTFAVLADALEHAHRAGVVHRDIKPGNVLIDRQGRPHLMDFGLAIGPGETQVTRTGTTPGTPLYMAPEQVSGSRAEFGPCTDVYGLGATLYHCLTLRAPFDGASTAQVFDAIVRHEPMPLRRLHPGAPRDLETIVAKAMQKQPDHRYASAAELRDDLENLLALRPIRARPSGRVTRTIRYVRRNPLPSALLAVGAAFALVAARPVWDVVAKVRSGERAFASYQQEASKLAPIQEELERLRTPDFLSEGERGRFAQLEERVEEQRLRTEAELARACELLDSVRGSRLAALIADDLDHRVFEILLLRADSASRRGSRLEADGYESKALSLAGTRAAEWYGSSVRIRCDAPDARAYLFRYQPYEALRDGAIPRQVPVPVRSDGRAIEFPPDGEFQPGDLSLLVKGVRAGGSPEVQVLRPGDLILRVGSGSVRESALYVRSVDPDGLAAAHGVRPFDTVTSVRGRGTRCLWDWESMPWQGPKHDPDFTCTIRKRDGSHKSLVAMVCVSEAWNLFSANVAPTRTRLGSRAERLGPNPSCTLEGAFGFEVAELASMLAGPLEEELNLHCLVSGSYRQISVPTGSSIECEITAYPLVLSAKNRIDLAAAPELRLPRGSYLALIESPGRVPLRLPFVVQPSSHLDFSTSPMASSEAPEGFVYVPPGPFIYQGEWDVLKPLPEEVLDLRYGFWISRHEVALSEWLEFLNDPSSASPSPADAERGHSLLPSFAVGGDGYIGYYGGKWVARGNMRPEACLVGIKLRYLQGFIAWKNLRASGTGWFYRLPTQEEWEKAARGVDGRSYPWGDRFDFTLCCSYLARGPEQLELLHLEPRDRFPTDESPYGVRDMAGSAAEFNEGHLEAPLTAWTPIRGGSWVCIAPASFKAASRHLGASDVPDRGFRLVAERMR